MNLHDDVGEEEHNVLLNAGSLFLRLPEKHNKKEDDEFIILAGSSSAPSEQSSTFRHTFRRLLLWSTTSALAAATPTTALNDHNKKSTTVLILGLRGAGATSLVYRLKLHDFIAPAPTTATLHESFKLRYTCIKHKWTHGGMPPLKEPIVVTQEKYCQMVEHKVNTIDVGRLSRFAKRFSGGVVASRGSMPSESPGGGAPKMTELMTEFLAPAIRKYLMVSNSLLILLDGTKIDTPQINFWKAQLSWLLYDVWVQRRKAKCGIVVTKLDMSPYDTESLVKKFELPEGGRGTRWQLFNVSSKTGAGMSQLATWLCFPPEVVASIEEEAYEQQISLMEREKALNELRRLLTDSGDCRFVLIPNGHDLNRFNFEHREALRLGYTSPINNDHLTTKDETFKETAKLNDTTELNEEYHTNNVISPTLVGRSFEENLTNLRNFEA